MAQPLPTARLTAASGDNATSGVDALERETIHRVAWRLLPILMLGYFCAYLDRVNVGSPG